jgi:hypothetical protein
MESVVPVNAVTPGDELPARDHNLAIVASSLWRVVSLRSFAVGVVSRGDFERPFHQSPSALLTTSKLGAVFAFFLLHCPSPSKKLF